jgi:hypothetical protein
MGQKAPVFYFLEKRKLEVKEMEKIVLKYSPGYEIVLEKRQNVLIRVSKNGLLVGYLTGSEILDMLEEEENE